MVFPVDGGKTTIRIYCIRKPFNKRKKNEKNSNPKHFGDKIVSDFNTEDTTYMHSKRNLDMFFLTT